MILLVTVVLRLTWSNQNEKNWWQGEAQQKKLELSNVHTINGSTISNHQ